MSNVAVGRMKYSTCVTPAGAVLLRDPRAWVSQWFLWALFAMLPNGASRRCHLDFLASTHSLGSTEGVRTSQTTLEPFLQLDFSVSCASTQLFRCSWNVHPSRATNACSLYHSGLLEPC